MENLIKVSKHTRAGSNGKIIYCPNCYTSTRVYHFAWAGLRCYNNDCNKFHEKNEWLVEFK